MKITDEMVNRFLSWKLPASARPDECVLDQSYPHRIGTNLLTAAETRQMLEHVLAVLPEENATAGVFRWIKEAVAIIKDEGPRSSRAELERYKRVEALLSGVPCPQEDLGFNSPADRAAREAIDAARYRWLRDKATFQALGAAQVHGEALDHACDRGLKAAPSPQRTPAPQGNQARADSSESGFKAPSGGCLPNTSGPAGAGTE